MILNKYLQILFWKTLFSSDFRGTAPVQVRSYDARVCHLHTQGHVCIPYFLVK